MTTLQQREGRDRKIATVVQMLRANIITLRMAVVLDKPDMMIEVVNEMDETIEELARLVSGSSN